MIAGGFVFGLFADRRPFGEIVPRASDRGVRRASRDWVSWSCASRSRRPVPEVIPERAIVVGFFLGIAAFLVGNFIGVHLLAPR